MRVIIAGTQGASFAQTLKGVQASPWGSHNITTIVSGMAYGPDTHGLMLARMAGIPPDYCPAAWHLWGRSAGPRRNHHMSGRADALIAIWDGKSRGTRDMLEKANRAGLGVYEHRIVLGDG